MARMIYCHPGRTEYPYHIYTDLDFWDARRIIRDLALVKRNFGPHPSGDQFPVQIVGSGLTRRTEKEIEKRLGKAIVAPPRHVIINGIISEGRFAFDPGRYYPAHWTPSRMLRFTYFRLPLDQSVLNSPYNTVRLYWVKANICVEAVKRDKKHDPAIRTRKEAMRRLRAPSCF
ncbi:MAG: hypothetical protein ABII06_01080 [Pseudomonadota bacterium]